MRTTTPWHLLPLLGLIGCGPEGLSASLYQAPLAVGTRTRLHVERCLKRDLVGPGKAILPCVSADPLIDLTVTGDLDKVTVTDRSTGAGERWLDVEATAPGHATLNVTAHDEQGQVFTASAGLDVFTPKTLRFKPFIPGGDDPRVSYLVGAGVSVPECEITDQRDLPYFNFDFATHTEGSLAASGNALEAVSTGEGVYEPLSAVLRAAGPAFRVTVADPGDVRGLVLARDLVNDAGEMSLPPQVVTALASVRLADGGVALGRAQVMPLFSLVDGGWAHPLQQDFEAATLERPDGGTTSWPCFASVCPVGGVVGTETYRLAGLSATVTVTAP